MSEIHISTGVPSRERDEHGDFISDRGLRYTDPVYGDYGGTVRVYESSAASAPMVWVAVENAREGTIHLSVEDARKFAENVLRVCDLHYQLREGEQ